MGIPKTIFILKKKNRKNVRNYNKQWCIYCIATCTFKWLLFFLCSSFPFISLHENMCNLGISFGVCAFKVKMFLSFGLMVNYSPIISTCQWMPEPSKHHQKDQAKFTLEQTRRQKHTCIYTESFLSSMEQPHTHPWRGGEGLPTHQSERESHWSPVLWVLWHTCAGSCVLQQTPQCSYASRERWR